MPRKEVSGEGVAPALGAYSPGLLIDGILYCSGQIALDRNGGLIDGGIAEQSIQVFRNLAAILQAGGKSLADVVKANVYLANIADFGAMDAVYQTNFSHPFPARTTIQTGALPLGALIAIDLVAQ
jgi:2-iminobutanoate/2-iminopropanoate deaminase